MHYFANLRSVRIEGTVAIIETFEGEGIAENPGRIVTWVVGADGRCIATQDADSMFTEVGQQFRSTGGDRRLLCGRRAES